MHNLYPKEKKKSKAKGKGKKSPKKKKWILFLLINIIIRFKDPNMKKEVNNYFDLIFRKVRFVCFKSADKIYSK